MNRKVKQPFTSVVICTYNREEVLIDTIGQVLADTYPHFELIVVDQTQQHAPSVERKLRGHLEDERFRLIRLSVASLPLARNVGLHAARGEVIIYCDDDVTLQPGFIAHHVEQYRKDDTAAVAGRVVVAQHEEVPPPRPKPHPPGRIRPDGMLETHFDQDYQGPVEWGQGCNMSFERSVLESIGGFDERFTGTAFCEEVEVFTRIRRAGHQADFAKDAALIHLESPTGGCRDEEEKVRRLRSEYRNRTLFALSALPLRNLHRFARQHLHLMWAAYRMKGYSAVTLMLFLWSTLEGVGAYLFQRRDRLSRALRESDVSHQQYPDVEGSLTRPRGEARGLRPMLRRLLRWKRPCRDVRLAPVQAIFPEAEQVQLLPEASLSTPEAPEMTTVPGAAHYRGAQLFLPEIRATILEDVLFCPVNNVVLTEEGDVVEESFTGVSKARYLDQHAISARRVVPLEGTHTAFRSRYNHYYHHLIDHAPRLYLLGHPALQSIGSVGLLLRDGPTAFEQYLIEGLAPPNVHVEALRGRGCLYRVERFVLLSPMTRSQAGCLRKEYVHYFQERMLPERPSRRDRRIYIAREKGRSEGRAVLNEREVLKALRPLGFEAHRLEDYSFEEQAGLFYDAEAVVAPHGAGLANLVYARDAGVVEWFASRHVVPHFYYLCKAMGHRYTYGCGRGAWRDDDMIIDADALADRLERLHLTTSVLV